MLATPISQESETQMFGKIGFSMLRLTVVLKWHETSRWSSNGHLSQLRALCRRIYPFGRMQVWHVAKQAYGNTHNKLNRMRQTSQLHFPRCTKIRPTLFDRRIWITHSLQEQHRGSGAHAAPVAPKRGSKLLLRYAKPKRMQLLSYPTTPSRC
jgi:hypothetical protein